MRIILATLALLAMIARASPSTSDLTTCTDSGQSRATCMHTLLP